MSCGESVSDLLGAGESLFHRNLLIHSHTDQQGEMFGQKPISLSDMGAGAPPAGWRAAYRNGGTDTGFGLGISEMLFTTCCACTCCQPLAVVFDLRQQRKTPNQGVARPVGGSLGYMHFGRCAADCSSTAWVRPKNGNQVGGGQRLVVAQEERK